MSRKMRVLIVCVALVIAARAAAQEPATRGVLRVSVTAASSEVPLPYAVLSIAQLSLERFTDARGRIVVPDVAPNTYDVVVRRLGYTPFRGKVTVRAGEPTELTVQLTRVAQRLSQQLVLAARPCPNPGLPDATREPEVLGLLSLLQENADRYRLLVDQYPFIYTQSRALGELRADVMFVQSTDAITSPGRSKVLYRKGGVVRREGRAYTMILPTILDLTDAAFVRAHCFFYGGATTQETASGTETWFQLDVRADDNLSSPDVHGTFFLDSATAQLRRMELQLSRPDRLPRDLRGIASLIAMTTFTEIANGISVLNAVCAITRLRPDVKRSSSANGGMIPTELQQLVRYVFTSPPPDVPQQRTFETQPWAPQTYLSRKVVWCDET
jgi:hypothetical protein